MSKCCESVSTMASTLGEIYSYLVIVLVTSGAVIVLVFPPVVLVIVFVRHAFVV